MCLSDEYYPWRVRRAIDVTALAFSLVPFASFYPYKTDVQPLFLIAILVSFLFHPKVKKFTSFDYLFLFCSIISIINFGPQTHSAALRDHFTIFIAFLSYLFFSKNFNLISAKIVFYIIITNIFVMAIHYFATDFYISTFGNFVRDVKVQDFGGGRGAAGLAAEPSFAGALSIFYLALLLYLRQKRNDVYAFWPSIFMTLIMLLMSKSGTGFLGLLILVCAYAIHVRGLNKLILTALIFFTIYSLASLNLIYGRLGVALNIFNDPLNFVSIDPSMGQRLYNIYVGFLSPLSNPLGSGLGSYNTAILMLEEKYDFLSEVNVASTGNVSAFARFSVELGVIFWVFLLLPMYYSIKKKVFYLYAIFLYFSLATFSLVFPPIAIALTLIMRGEK